MRGDAQGAWRVVRGCAALNPSFSLGITLPSRGRGSSLIPSNPLRFRVRSEVEHAAEGAGTYAVDSRPFRANPQRTRSEEASPDTFFRVLNPSLAARSARREKPQVNASTNMRVMNPGFTTRTLSVPEGSQLNKTSAQRTGDCMTTMHLDRQPRCHRPHHAELPTNTLPKDGCAFEGASGDRWDRLKRMKLLIKKATPKPKPLAASKWWTVRDSNPGPWD